MTGIMGRLGYALFAPGNHGGTIRISILVAAECAMPPTCLGSRWTAKWTS